MAGAVRVGGVVDMGVVVENIIVGGIVGLV